MGYIASGASVSLDGITFSMTAVQTGETATHATYALSLSTSGSTPHATTQRIEGNASDPATARGGWFDIVWGTATGPSTWTTTATIPKSGGVRFYQYNRTESPSKNSEILFLYTGDPPPVVAVPAAPIIDNPTEGFVWWSGSPGFYGTADLGVEVWVSQDGGTFHLASRAPDPDPGWAWGGESTLPDGTHYYSAFARNVAGDSPTVSVSFSVDTQAPAAPVVVTPANGSNTSDSTPTVSGTGEPGATVSVVVDGATVGTTTVDGAGNWTYTLATALSEGAHSVRATQTDGAGNTSVVSNTNTFTVDTVAPGAPVVVTPANGSNTSDSTPTVSGTGEPGATVQVTVDGTVVATVTANGSGNWSWTATVPLADGPHTVNATQTDASGNTSPVSNTNTFTVDTTAPAAPVILSHPAEMVYRQPFTVSGAAEPGTWIMCWAADNNPEMQVLPDGTWSFAFTADDWPPLEDWDPNQWVGNEVSARAYDSAGNYGPTTRVLVEVLPLITEPEEPEPEPADPNWLLALGIVQALCGGRWTYPALRVVDRLPYPVNGRLRLDGQPLQTVHTVTTSGTAIPFERIGNASIRFAERREGGTFCNPPAEVEVEYTYGWDTLPPRLKAAVDRLAEELTAAETGGACQIPERVMSVSRQGMSWDLIDPMEFLDAGRTGIYEVDLALRTYNPGGSRRKARVFSVDRPPPERIVIAYAHP